ncbi:hypothetical protein WJX77_011121 [Trebouxia sp. C0004]
MPEAELATTSSLEDTEAVPSGAAQPNGHASMMPAATAGRAYTVSIAVPGSVIDNTQTMELATAVAGQIARTAAIFKIDEVIVIDDATNREPGTIGAGAAFLARVLQFMETPQYLRRALIPMHADLRLAGTLPPLDAPHHMRATEWATYRDGIVLSSVPGEGSLLNVGLDKDAYITQALRTNVRVTLQMGPQPTQMTLQQAGLGSGQQVLFGQLAKPSSPRESEGTYWGYTTRLATSLSQVFQDCPFEGRYDLTVGTSERGTVVPGPEYLQFPPFQHLLVGFGGPQGLEERYISFLHPLYQPPSASSLRKTWLNRIYAQTINEMKGLLLTVVFPQTVTLVFDGWTNIHYESVWSFIALLPVGALILKTVNASADSHTADFIAAQVEDLFQDFDHTRFGAIVSDNGGGCQNARKLVVKNHKHMVEKRCMMHGYALDKEFEALQLAAGELAKKRDYGSGKKNGSSQRSDQPSKSGALTLLTLGS